MFILGSWNDSVGYLEMNPHNWRLDKLPSELIIKAQIYTSDKQHGRSSVNYVGGQTQTVRLSLLICFTLLERLYLGL